MKPFFITVLSLALSLAGAQATAVLDTHHQLVIHGTLSTVAVTSGTVDNIVTFSINNAKILAAVSGTTGILVKNLDIVMDDVTAEIDVIKIPIKTGTTTSAPVVEYVLGYGTSPTTTDAELHDKNSKHTGGLELISDYQIALPPNFAPVFFPNIPGPATTDLFLKLGQIKHDTDEFASVTAANFYSGYGEGTSQCYIIQGVASTTGKTYSY